MVKIPYSDINRSNFVNLIKNQLGDFNGKIEIILKDIGAKGYKGHFEIKIDSDNNYFLASDFTNPDISRFPARIRAAATALKLLEHEGHYIISHNKGVINIETSLKDQELSKTNFKGDIHEVINIKKDLRKLKLNDLYSREDIHSIFSPETKFTPGAGTWGMHGIVPIPNRENGFVIIVTYGQSAGAHTFDEGITTEGVLSWQSQPHEKLSDKRIQKLINHDEINDNIYLFLREKEGLDYEYLGRLKYLSHDNERQMPVYFQWQLLDWNSEKSENEPLHDFTKVGELILGNLEPTNNKPTKKTAGISLDEFRTRKAPDYALRDQKNKRLGDLGEELVVRYEKNLLESLGKKDLADKIVHVSKIEGDGAGYDVKSYDQEGSVKYIEVKTTRGNINTDFFMSPREIKFSQMNRDHFFYTGFLIFPRKMMECST